MGSGTAVKKKPGRAKRIIQSILRDKWLWLMALPGIVWYLIFAYGPMYGLVIAFESYSPGRGILGGPWVGLKWFREFFHVQTVGRLIRNTVAISVLNLIFGFPVPIILALLLNEVRSGWFKKTAQTISYLPHFISTVIVVGMVVNFLSAEGPVNSVIMSLGHEPIYFMMRPEYFRPIYIISGIWQSAGWGSIIYLAAISGVDPTLYEAATVDGASRIRQIWHITIPGILPTVVILLIMNCGSILSVGYEKIILMYNTQTYETADVINTYVYRRGLGNGEFSFGTAVGLFQSVINLIILTIANWISRKLTESSLW